jgi:hypothetical protein
VCNGNKHEGRKERRKKIATKEIKVAQKDREMESEERIECRDGNRKQRRKL